LETPDFSSVGVIGSDLDDKIGVLVEKRRNRGLLFGGVTPIS
jgi:hypothetical protein